MIQLEAVNNRSSQVLTDQKFMADELRRLHFELEASRAKAFSWRELAEASQAACRDAMETLQV